ncbi:hypothetical protein [Pelomonas aquatica]|jgi:hypothetical protein|uniref:Uncharacterized protein n=1 Tax=Pelomonas aquatica TaxID=431058 RepID=A0A9X4LHQ7_9BURK|nr:hypothetical protein [Pelomonas aquatica]MCY4754664.1 hypothetical protein [Pelomonas aquatica]MDG0863750.1 hypothetical protein [Pelomonas aquatica]
MGGLEVVDADLQLHRAPDLPERLQHDQRRDLDRGFVDGTRLPTAAGPDMRQRLCPDLAADLDGQFVERADMRTEYAGSDLPGRLHADDCADLQRWHLGRPGLRSELPPADMPGWHDTDRARDLEQHHEQLERSELHAGDATAGAHVPGRLHNADGTGLGRNLLVLADLRAARGSARPDVRQWVHANDCADLER